MSIKKINGWGEKSGTYYWGRDRLERMIDTRNLKGEEEALILLDRLELGAKIKNIADVGSGIGRRHKYFGGLEYVAFDREKIMVENGRKYFPSLIFNLCDIQEMLEKFPFYKGYFDLVLTYHVLQYNHIEQQYEMLKNINGIIKPGGVFYMKENTIYKHNNIGYKNMDETHSINGSSFTESGWVRHVEKHGFKIKHKAGKDGHFIFIKG